MNGKGVLTWKDGRTYRGNFVNDKKELHGSFEWADGRKYSGDYQND